ncbi:MAG: histidine--tRNA ligase [Leptospiraceae bacterium]|nr:histidine--tRNA ligase [Leptospiraceae bacterium]
MRVRNWMFSTMRSVVESFGYQEYDGPMLESFDLYKAKSGEEIVGRQLYDFIDKGERHVAIRPEMTPTLARMVAAKARELPRPIRWFSIPNLWRYEAPGHGRLREHWQLNVDLFGINNWKAELEIIQLACEILFAFGAPKESFRVKFSNRKILTDFLTKSLGLDPEKEQAVAKILDKKNKVSKEEFEISLKELLTNPESQLTLIYKYLESDVNSIVNIEGIATEAISEVKDFYSAIEEIGLSENVEFDPSIIRGFDYYTGFIFEIFDTSPENRRSLYGGGRYDNLIGLFSNEELSGIGFGLGDVTLENFLKTHNLIPEFKERKGVFLCPLGESSFLKLNEIAGDLRKLNIPCEMSLDGKSKLGKQISIAEKKGYRYMILLGEEEIQKKEIIFKDLKESSQNSISFNNYQKELQRIFT